MTVVILMKKLVEFFAEESYMGASEVKIYNKKLDTINKIIKVEKVNNYGEVYFEIEIEEGE